MWRKVTKSSPHRSPSLATPPPTPPLTSSWPAHPSQYCTNTKANTVFCLETPWISTKEVEEIMKEKGWKRCRVAELMDSLTLLRHGGGSLLQNLQAMKYNTCSHFSFTTGCTVLHSHLCQRKDYLLMHPILVQRKKKRVTTKREEFTRSDTSIDIVSVCECVEDEFSPEPTGGLRAQHTQGKHHWTQSQVSRY